MASILFGECPTNNRGKNHHFSLIRWQNRRLGIGFRNCRWCSYMLKVTIDPKKHWVSEEAVSDALGSPVRLLNQSTKEENPVNVSDVSTETGEIKG